MWAKLKKCYKEFGCWDKTGIANAINQGIVDLLESGEGGGAVTIDAEISGYIPAGNPVDGVTHNVTTGSIWGYSLPGVNFYDADTYGAVPNIGPVVNPACGPEIGTLVINPNLPEGSDGTFDVVFETVNNSGGMGHMFPFCPDTGEIGPYVSVGGSFQNNTSPTSHTVSLDASGLSCPPEDVLVGFAAFGVASNLPDACDELDPTVGAITIVTPSKLGAARECFKQLFCDFDINTMTGIDPDDSTGGDNDGNEEEKIRIRECIAEQFIVQTCPALHAYGATGPAGTFGQKCNATVTRVSEGIYQVTFNTPHPDGADYPVTFGSLNDGEERDGTHAEVINGTQNASGFQYYAATGDNSGTADILVDRWVSWQVPVKKQVVFPRNNTTEEIKACFAMTGFDYEQGAGFWGSGAFAATVNGTATSTPWNFTGAAVPTTGKSAGYQAMIDAINALPGWSVVITSDPTMNTTNLVGWEFQYCGPPGAAAELEIIRTSSGPDTIKLDANTNTGSFTDANGPISDGRQPVPC